MMKRGFLSILVPFALLSGCAYVTAVPAPPGSDVRGIRVPDIKPLLVVTGGTVEVITVPNPNRAYAVQFGSFLAKHNLEAEFSNGFINSIKSDQDATAFSIELLKSITEAAKAGTGIFDGFSDKTGDGAATDLQVYDIVFDDQGNLLSLRALITKDNIEPYATLGQAQSIPDPKEGDPDSVDFN